MARGAQLSSLTFDFLATTWRNPSTGLVTGTDHFA
jgi:hypothetical protein